MPNNNKQQHADVAQADRAYRSNPEMPMRCRAPASSSHGARSQSLTGSTGSTAQTAHIARRSSHSVHPLSTIRWLNHQ